MLLKFEKILGYYIENGTFEVLKVLSEEKRLFQDGVKFKIPASFSFELKTQKYWLKF